MAGFMKRIIGVTCGVFCLGLAAIAATAQAEPVVYRGPARVIDSDMLEIDGTKIILFGVDAMDRNQQCQEPNGKAWDCWAVAARELQILVEDAEVECVDSGISDPFRRVYAVCTVGETDIGEAMVRRGMALAFVRQGKDYVDAQKEAKAEKRGVWRGKFMEPWKHRMMRGAPGAR